MLLSEDKMDTVYMLEKIVPDVMGIIRERYMLLRYISESEPIGRRALATMSGLSERVVRAHVDILRRSGMVHCTTRGIMMEVQGKRILPDIVNYFLQDYRLVEMRQAICQYFGLKEVIIVPGDSDINPLVKEEMARQAAILVSDILGKVKCAVVSGGSTMALVADCLPLSRSHTMILPARGSMGNIVELQANTIAAGIAKKIQGSYRMIHLPEEISEAALQLMLKEDVQLQQNVTLAQSAQAVIFGIGRADLMAKKRGLSKEKQQWLQQQRACGEALGTYCTQTGRIIVANNKFGVSLLNIKKHAYIIAVAGGTQKSAAIMAVLSACRTGIFVTDEGAAMQIWKVMSGKDGKDDKNRH